VRFVLGLLDSSRVTLAVVFGIPLAIGVVVALGLRRRTPTLVLVAGTLVVAGIAVLAAWAVFQPAGPQAAGSTAPSPGAGGPAPQPVSLSCSPSGTRLQEVAKGIAYEKKCLAAPAGQAFTIEFDNQDAGTPHNIHIFSADPSKDPNAGSLFSGELVTGPATATYEVRPLAAGRYFFHCDVHPTQMVGGFVVGEV
jgi:plastocyanin